MSQVKRNVLTRSRSRHQNEMLLPQSQSQKSCTATGKDWKLNPEVQVKVNLNTNTKSPVISNEVHNPHCSNSRSMTTLPIKGALPDPKEIFTDENRDEILFDYESNCNVCHEYILRFTQHIRESHQRNEFQQMELEREDLSAGAEETIENYLDDEERINVEEIGAEVQIPESSSSMNFQQNTNEHNSAQTEPETEEEIKIETGAISDSDSEYVPDYSENIDGLELNQENSTTELEFGSIEKAKTLLCEICDEKFHRQSNLTKHLQLHRLRDKKTTGDYKAKIRRHSCPKCNKSYGTVSGLRVHYRRTHKKLLNRDLTAHIEVNEERNYSCDLCDKSYFNHRVLWEHRRIKHKGITRKSYRCKFCALKFTAISERNDHTKSVHYQEIDKTCKICGKVCQTNSKLKDHERTHTGDHPFKCEICSKCFVSNDSLRNHDKIHLEESGEWVRPWVCDICGDRFTRKYNLIAHASKHTEERPHICDQCGKRFKTQIHLNRHLKTHIKEN